MISMIPIMRPKLPAAERIAPYLRRIDEARIYSNFGPLVVSFEARLATHLGLAGETVATVANATMGLMLALQALGARPGRLCVMPAWTFIASAHAAMLAGLVPYFVDVDPTTWTLAAADLSETIAQAPATVGAVMPVAPFGQPVDVAAWDRFHARTGLPVVIDAAAGFDALAPGVTPAVVSLHATKVIGVGEGGFVVSRDAALIRDIRTRSNFGFDGIREAVMPAANAKLSEYHAAIGHAALDEWHDARTEWMAVASDYRRLFATSNQFQFQQGFGESWVASTCVLRLAENSADRAEQALAAARIDTRRWWGRGAHSHPATKALPRATLPATEDLALATIAVPFYRDLDRAAIERVAECLCAAL
jgi:dTDP-4-amino-4,6-dideoxygalactose transaminase